MKFAKKIILTGISISFLLLPSQGAALNLNPFDKNSDFRRGLRNIDPTNPSGNVGKVIRGRENPKPSPNEFKIINRSNKKIYASIGYYLQADC